MDNNNNRSKYLKVVGVEYKWNYSSSYISLLEVEIGVVSLQIFREQY